MGFKSIQKDYEQALNDVKNMNSEKRANAIANLGVYGNEKDLPVIKQALNDSAEAVKVAALYSLALQGEKQYAEKLMEYLDNERDLFRKLAKAALEAVCVKKFSDPLKDMDSAKKAKQEWSDWWKANSAKLTFDKKKKIFG